MLKESVTNRHGKAAVVVSKELGSLPQDAAL
jgi:hypothetical protein